MQVQSLASLSGLRIWHCCELWCRLPMCLRSGIAVAVAVASSCSSNLTPSLGISKCHGSGPEKKKKRGRSFICRLKNRGTMSASSLSRQKAEQGPISLLGFSKICFYHFSQKPWLSLKLCTICGKNDFVIMNRHC